MNNLQSFFSGLSEIRPTSFIFIIFILLISSVFYWFAGKSSKNTLSTKTMVYASLCISLSFILSYITLYKWPQGGSITLASMLPLMIFSYIFGTRNGIMAGLVYSILQFIQEAYVVHWAQLIIDYPLAFAALGLAGLAKNNLSLGVLIAGFGRFFFHFIAGAIFFASYAPVGQGAFLYSFIVNASLIGTDTLICLIVSLIPSFKNAINNFKNKLTI